MRRNGILALIIYSLGVAAGGFLAIWAYAELQVIENSSEPGWEAVGAAIIIALGLFIALPSGVSLILKIIQLITGFKIFGVLCMILDVVVIASLVYNILTTTDNGNTLVEAATIIPTSLAFISNAFSLSD